MSAADVGRRVVITDPNDGRIIIDALITAVADENNFTFDDEVAIDYIGATATIYDVNGNLPGKATMQVNFVNSRDRLTLGGRQDIFSLPAYFDGRVMYFRDPSTTVDPLTSFEGTMTVRTTAVPVTLAQVPAGLIGELALIMAELIKTADKPVQNRGVDLAAMKGG
jgi:hypothetical protein